MLAPTVQGISPSYPFLDGDKALCSPAVVTVNQLSPRSLRFHVNPTEAATAVDQDSRRHVVSPCGSKFAIHTASHVNASAIRSSMDARWVRDSSHLSGLAHDHLLITNTLPAAAYRAVVSYMRRALIARLEASYTGKSGWLSPSTHVECRCTCRAYATQTTHTPSWLTLVAATLVFANDLDRIIVICARGLRTCLYRGGGDSFVRSISSATSYSKRDRPVSQQGIAVSLQARQAPYPK